MSKKPFRFGVIAETFSTAAAWRVVVQRTEALGYDTLLIRDHFVEEPFGHQLAPFSALATAAAWSSTLRLGTLVIDNDFRHPAVLAKEAAALDLLSAGRFELGLGAGWLREEYERTGIAFDPAGIRISRLEEALPIIRGLLDGETVTRLGCHYQIDGLVNFPRSRQPRLPILIGGGSPRILKLAGRVADIVGILTASVASGVMENKPDGRRSAAVRERIGWIREGAGPRFPGIELSLVLSVIIAADRDAATDDYIARQGWIGIGRDDVWDMPSVLIGSEQEIAAQLTRIRDEYGFSYFVVPDRGLDAFAPIAERIRGT